MDFGTSIAFFSLTSINWLICLFGTFGNGLIVFVNLKDNSLHTTCNVLIAMNSLSDALTQFLWVFVFTWIQFGQPQWPLQFCTILAIPSLICFVSSYFFILVISLDRLLSILSPIRYQHLNRPFYFGALFSATLFYCALMMNFPVRNILSDPNRLVVCQPPATLFGPLGDLFHISCLILNIFTASLYALLWLLLNAKQNKMKYEDTRRLFKSILAITLVVLGGWIINAISKLLGPMFTPNTLQQIFFSKGSQILNNISVSSNLLVLYFCSRKYNIALRKVLSKWWLFDKFISINDSSITVIRQAANIQQRIGNGRTNILIRSN